MGRARTAAAWLGLAASPVFVAMALLTHAWGGDAHLCMGGGFPLGGMAAMYWLMSAVHLSPWLRLASGNADTPERGAE